LGLSKNNSNDNRKNNGNSRFPAGMTKRKATARTTASTIGRATWVPKGGSH